MMEHTVAYVEAIKKNQMKKCKRVVFPYELLGSCGNKLTAHGREMNKISSVMHFSARSEVVNCEIKYENPNKASSKL